MTANALPQHGCTGALRLAGGGGKQWSRRRGGQCRQCRESSHSLAGPLRDGLITGDKGQSSCAIAKDSAVCGKARDDRSSVAGSACSRQRGGARRGRRAATHANPSSQTIPAPLLHACGVVRAASERRSTPARAVAAPPCAERQRRPPQGKRHGGCYPGRGWRRGQRGAMWPAGLAVLAVLLVSVDVVDGKSDASAL